MAFDRALLTQAILQRLKHVRSRSGVGKRDHADRFCIADRGSRPSGAKSRLTMQTTTSPISRMGTGMTLRAATL